MDITNIKTKSRLLKRQIKKKLGDLNCKDYSKILEFINSIDEEYSDARENRELLERSLDLSSAELSENNNKLKIIIDKNIKINKELEKSKEYLSMILSNLGEGLIVVDSEKKIITANNKASELSNYSINELIGKKYNKYITFLNDSKNKIKEKDYILETLEKGSEFILDQNIILKGKNIKVPIFITFTPLNYYSLKGKRACIIVFRDATKERELSKMKNDFLSIASHELRTPMTIIKGFSSLLIKEKLGNINNNQKKYLERIHSNSNNLIEMVNDMLDINKLEAGKMEFNFEKFNLKNTAENTCSEMKDLFLKKEIKILCELLDFELNSDSKKIKQVIINLLSNSYKFSKKNTEIKLKMQIVDENKIKVSIIDKGSGIKKENLEKLFKKFSQIGNHLNKAEKGTGLGLSLSKQIIEGLGGRIGVKSIFGKGSEFYFILPKNKH